MPAPYTDEQLLIDDLGGGRTLDDIYIMLNLLFNEIAALRARADAGALPPAAVLVNEFMMGSDLDGGGGAGGSVYGQDFQIDPADPAFPVALGAIHQHPNFPGTPPVTLTWAAYLATL